MQRKPLNLFGQSELKKDIQWQTNGLLWLDNFISNVESRFNEKCNVEPSLPEFNATKFA